MTKDEKSLVSRRERWLVKKKLTVRELADSVGLDYNTVFRWVSEPRRLHKLYAERVKQTHRDFPLK
jgi:hypothetical protein